MGFEGLLGNDRLKQNLTQSMQRGRIAHFYLISGPEGSGKHTLARYLAAAILCGNEDGPCLRCNTCRKVMADTHPDFITVDDPEKKTVPVELIRKARADIYIQPNEADRKIYLFPRAQDMGIPGQNALLKVLEEPPSYGVFILLADNPGKLLPTVRSRCTELSLQALPEKVLKAQLAAEFPKATAEELEAAVARSGGYLGQAKKLMASGCNMEPEVQQIADAFCSRSQVALLQVLTSMEKWKRDRFIPVLEQCAELMHGALLCRSGSKAVSPLARQLSASCSAGELMNAVRELKKCTEYAQGNVSVAAICGYLVWHLR